MKRHPKLSSRQPGSLPMSRAKGCSNEVLDKWFKDFDQVKWSAEQGRQDLECWWIRISLATQRGSKTVYAVTSSSKQQITTLACINASGSAIPSMHVFPGERFKSNPLEGAVHGAYLGRSTSGWMDTDLFNGWLTNYFSKSIPPTRPVVLLLDGHSSHINLRYSQMCQKGRYSSILFATTHYPCTTAMWCGVFQAHEGQLE